MGVDLQIGLGLRPRQAGRSARDTQVCGHAIENLFDGEDDGIQGLLTTMGVDLQIGLGLLNGLDELLEILVGHVLAGENGESIALFLIHHAIDAIERDLMHVGAHDINRIADDAHNVTVVDSSSIMRLMQSSVT